MGNQYYIEPLQERFDKKWKIDLVHSYNGTPCHTWIASCNKEGRGRIWVNGGLITAPKVKWFIVHGIWPVEEVCHYCNNPNCVNIEHFYVGSHKENMQQSFNEGRMPLGELRFSACLSEEQVREIRRDTRSRRKLALIYGVAQGTIQRIKTGLTWKHIG